MERERIKSLFKHISDFHKNENFENGPQLNVEGKLKPELRNYQVRAVKWMLTREKENKVVNLLGNEITLPRGGILADEMGLGKTVEVLACIMSNERQMEEYELRKVRSKYLKDIHNSEDEIETSDEEYLSKGKKNKNIDKDKKDYELTNRKRRKSKKKINKKKSTDEEQEDDSEHLDDEEEYMPPSKIKRRIGKKISKICEVSSKRKKSGDSGSQRVRERYSQPKGVLYNHVKQYYESALSEMSCADKAKNKQDSFKHNRNATVKCFCDNSDSEKMKLVQCEECKIWQHAECLGIENGYSFGNVRCPQCWSKSEIIPAKATLIITPPSILNQWIQEIEKHINLQELKVFAYQGVKGHNYVQPPTLAGYDVVITSYNVLCSEINYLQAETGRSLRHAKKYYSPMSPLTCLDWWRICLDEAQMVEGYSSKKATMASHLIAQNRWAVTGTPIQKYIGDIFGLILFLKVDGLESDSSWRKLSSSGELFQFLCHLLWRNSKADVLGELGVPPQEVLTHWLHFSPVEGHFYRTVHSESATLFRVNLNRVGNLDTKLVNIDRRLLMSIMKPLLGVRQACNHPQVVRGKFIKFKHTMTMEELLEQMILKATKDAEGSLRQLIAAIHGLAAIHIINFEWHEAVEKYREVIALSNKYASDIKVDGLQLIHCFHNLADVLDNHGAGIPPTLRDSTLKEEAKTLEKKYLEKHHNSVGAAQAELAKITASVAQLCKHYTLGYTGWWDKLIKACDDEEEEEDLVYRINSFLDDNIIPGQTKLSSRLHHLMRVHSELSSWLANSDSLREEVKDSMRRLELIAKDQLIGEAFVCHINNARRRKTAKKPGTCPLCITEVLIKKYEAQIFSVRVKEDSKRQKRKKAWEESESEEENNSDDEIEEEEGQSSKGNNKNEGDRLRKVNIFISKKEGSWKPAPQELILQVLAGHAKRVNAKLSEEGAQHLTLMQTVRKEFKAIRAVWRAMSDQVYATDELYMAKLRLRLPLYLGESTKDDIFILNGEEVPLTRAQLQTDYAQYQSTLIQTTGTLLYLKNLKRNGTVEQECPVCKESLTDKWSVLSCGHCCCFNCIPELLKIGGDYIYCPLCRIRTSHNQVSYVQSQRDNDFDYADLVRNYSTKVSAVVSKLLSLIKEDPTVKVLIFSTWEKVLDIIRDALVQTEVSFCRLECGGNKFKESLHQFKQRPTVNALLLTLKHGSKGLNLTEATHIFFVEPILNPAEELQAVGRIHRIGQTKPTFVHRFIVSNTIEERMLSSLETSGAEEWAQENVTLRKLNDLFILKDGLGAASVCHACNCAINIGN